MANVEIEAHVHEQAATVSATFMVNEGRALPFGVLIDAMQSIAEKAETAGAIVGHIKAFGRSGDAFAHGSVTAAGFAPTCEGDVSADFTDGSDVQLVAIVMLIELDELVEIMRSCIAEI